MAGVSLISSIFSCFAFGVSVVVKRSSWYELFVVSTHVELIRLLTTEVVLGKSLSLSSTSSMTILLKGF